MSCSAQVNQLIHQLIHHQACQMITMTIAKLDLLLKTNEHNMAEVRVVENAEGELVAGGAQQGQRTRPWSWCLSWPQCLSRPLRACTIFFPEW